MTVPKIGREGHPAGTGRVFAENYDLAQVTAERLRSIGATAPPPRLDFSKPIPARFSWLVKVFEDGRWGFEPFVSRAEAQARAAELRPSNPSVGVLQVCDETHFESVSYEQELDDKRAAARFEQDTGGGRTW